MIRVLSTFLLTVALAGAEPAITFEKIVRYQGEVAGQFVEVSIHQGNYDFSKHKIAGGEENSVDQPAEAFQPAKIDGIEIAGTDGMNPFVGVDEGRMVRETIRSIELKWNGRNIDVPKALHINLLGLTLAGDMGWKTIQFVPNSRSDALLIQATGGDGGASYMVSLILRKDGSHRQFYHGYWEDHLPSEAEAWESIEAEQDGAEQSATAPQSKPEGNKKSIPAAEGRSR